MANNNAAKSTKIELQDLQQSVNTLLQQIDRACDGIAKRHEAGAAVAGREAFEPVEVESEEEAIEDSAATPDADLSAQVDEMINDALSAAGAVQDSIRRGETATTADSAALEEMADQAVTLADEASRAAGDERQKPESAREGSAVAAEPEIATDEEPVFESNPLSDATIEDESATDAAASDPVHVEDFDGAEAADVADSTADDEAVAVAAGPELANSQGEADSPAIQALDATIEAEAAALEEELDELEGDFESADQVSQAAEVDEALPTSADDILNDEESTDTDIEIDSDDSVRSRKPAQGPERAPARSSEIDSPFAGDGEAVVKPAAKKAVKHNGASSRGGAKKKTPAKKGSKKKSSSSVPVRERAVRVVLAPMARPLAALDPSVRDTIGWVGVNTLFIALCLWLFLMLK